jgi:protein-L-isoaspartate(D-aspartate) O-methyltransferase
MTEKLEPSPTDVVLEVGTGSGYQAAILSQLVREVWSVEVVAELAERSARLLERLGCANVHVRHGDGTAGWVEHAPYDAIIVTAAAPRVPEVLLGQLRVGGRMVLPVESDLLRIVREPDGTFRREWLCAVSFVPMTGAIRE